MGTTVTIDEETFKNLSELSNLKRVQGKRGEKNYLVQTLVTDALESEKASYYEQKARPFLEERQSELQERIISFYGESVIEAEVVKALPHDSINPLMIRKAVASTIEALSIVQNVAQDHNRRYGFEHYREAGDDAYVVCISPYSLPNFKVEFGPSVKQAMTALWSRVAIEAGVSEPSDGQQIVVRTRGFTQSPE